MLIASLVVILIFAAVLAPAAIRPNTFSIKRTAVIRATPGHLFELLNNFQHWTEWSPFKSVAPSTGLRLGGAPNGIGSTFEWEGNKTHGYMEIIDAVPAARLLIKVNFVATVDARIFFEISLEGKGDETVVTWTTSGPASVMVRAIHIYTNALKWLGSISEKGLVGLKAIAEG